MSPLPARRPLRRGFTLIELMVSTALMVVIVIAVVSIAAETFKAYDRAVADLATQSEARSVLDAMETDFQTAVIRPDGRCWMEIVLPGSGGSGGPSTPAGPPPSVGNLSPAEHPIIMLFAAPQDRPRWKPDQNKVALAGDVCAVAYRIGQRSPFSSPGAKTQQVYGVYRTIIDSEKTFAEALPIILSSTAANPVSPWDYWAAPVTIVGGKPYTRTYGDYNQQKYVTNAPSMISATVSAASLPWTLDDHNFLASNVVAMNLVLWCTSSLSPTSTPADPLLRPSLMLRPVLPINKSDGTDLSAKFGSGTGYRDTYSTASTPTATAGAAMHFATTPPTTQGSTLTMLAGITHPYEEFSGRLRICSDRIYPDSMSSKVLPVVGPPAQLPYLPYSLRAIEVSVTVLTPEGAKELASLQSEYLGGSSSGAGTKVKNSNDFRRIVVQQGRAYTRYIRLLSNGG